MRTGDVSIASNLSASFVDSFNRDLPRFNNKSVVLVAFEGIPTEQSKALLKANGIEVYNYIAPGLYSATISGNANAALLRQAKATALIPLTALQKIDPLLAGNKLPSWSIKIPGTIDVIISFPKSFSYTDVARFLKEKNIDIVADKWSLYGKLSVRLSPIRLSELASFPFVEYVSPAEPELEVFNHKSRQLTRANVLNASIANGGLGLNGEGVVVGIGDNTIVSTHIDFSGRLFDRNTANASHGIHVAGTAAGGGIINELYRGFAPKATIVNALQDDVVTGLYVQDYNMVLTNNSYGPGFNCDFNGLYMVSGQYIDQLAFDFPSLLNIYAGGNYANNVCAPYPAGFNTVSTLWQSAKNPITVGATTDSGDIGNFSSRGPVRDGRIKPEIVAMGQQVTSTWPTNIYSFNSGTSMAAPAVTGGLALLYQRYRQLHGGADPKNGLMKAILCNGATDKGNPGPDYTYGFGWMNLVRSVDMLNKQAYVIASSNQNGVNSYNISVPAGTAQVKVMLYWNDPPASPLAARSLVNDLDLEIITPSSAVVLPLVLDTFPARVNNNAVNGVDRTNNIEQVVIDQPTAGNYTIRIKGTAIAQNPSQEFFLVYDVVPVSVALTYPVGGEAMVPGESVKISWDEFGNTDKTFNLQFSADNGASWTNIATDLAAARRIYTWQVPAIVTTNAMVRIVQNGTALTNASRTFTIVGLPVVTLSPVQCETYMAIDWAPIAGADHYEVMMLGEDEMKVMDTVTTTHYKFTGLSKEKIYWVSVRAKLNGKPGRRSIAISYRPIAGNCSGSISDNDLIVESLVSPATGRKNTSATLLSTHAITVRIKNLDDAPANNFSVSYAVNNGQWLTENIAVTLAPGSSYDHTFNTTADLSATGVYKIATVVKNTITDPSVHNDTLVTDVRHLNNQPINLANTFLDDLETAASATYARDTIGMMGVDRYDFQSATKSGQVTTFLNTGFAYSGSKAFIIGEIFPRSAIGQNYLMGTFNLSNYSTAANNLRADFRFINTQFTLLSTVWARGADDQPWIKLYDALRTADTNYRRSPSLAIADSLAKYGQDFTGSFQLRWGEWSLFQSMNKRRLYALDDIRLYQVFNDVQALRVDTPSVMSCGVTGNVPVKLLIHNSHFSALNNIPVKYSVNGGQWVEEVIPSIAGKATYQYVFNQPMNMTANGSYKVTAVVSYPADNFRENDTVVSEIQSSVLVTSYPYLQNFESGHEGWYTTGKNSSWEYGLPASTKIKGAASGAKAWKTRLSGNHNENEFSYLYSPCFALNGLTRPALSFSVSQDIEDCGSPSCDGAWVEYTLNGTTWFKLNSSLVNTNWYNNPGQLLWNNLTYTRWHVATSGLPASTGVIRFRFVFSSNGFGNNEGIAIDDIHLYENASVIYDSVSMTSPVTETVSANGWTDFKVSGKLLASVHPGNQNIGPVDAQVYINTSGVRNTSTQYYHDRNLTLKSANPLSDSVTVRFYFLDKETDS
ncbi:MAG: S8 family serine peptidase, partial [Chitinophagaceae bacterium]